MFGAAARKTLSINTHISAYKIHFKIIIPPMPGCSPFPYKYFTRTIYILFSPDDQTFFSRPSTSVPSCTWQTYLHACQEWSNLFVHCSCPAWKICFSFLTSAVLQDKFHPQVAHAHSQERYRTRDPTQHHVRTSPLCWCGRLVFTRRSSHRHIWTV